MALFSNIQLGAIAVALIAIILYRRLSSPKSLPLPPGPKGLPFIGNINDLPPPGKAEYLHWLKFKDLYGGLSSITILGQPMIIIHDRVAVDVLLEKTSLKTSGRAKQPFAAECGFDRMLPGRQYTTESRRHRKYIHQQLGTLKAASEFNHVQDIESRRLLFRALVDPDNLTDHFKKEAAAIILRITYGYSPEPHGKDPLVGKVEEMMDNMSSSFVPLSWGLDIVPWLRYIPEGLPGAGWKKTARDWFRVTESVYDLPYNFVQQQMSVGSCQPSYVSRLIQHFSHTSANSKPSLEDENMIKETAGILYGGAADTTISTFSSFILAMILFPKVQRKAQAEIDQVVGTTRLPTWEDRKHLPYVNALVKESLRWFPVVPMTTAHAVDEEITYDGYRIPRGSLLLPAAYWFLHDPEVYPDPNVFDPERFIEPRNEVNPETYVFGYGRRVCPGRYLADNGLFITISRLLAAFEVSRAMDEKGRELEVKLEPLPGVISHPAPYPFIIKARSAEHEELVRAVERDHPWEESDARKLNLSHAEA